MKIIGIDPGYAIVGWGVLEYSGSSFSVLNYGAITTAKDIKFSKRLESIYNELSLILNYNKPDFMSIEQLFFSSNKKTAIDVAQARGVILLCAQIFKIPVFEYAPVQVKQAVTGYGRATKKQVMDMVKFILNLKRLPKPDDTADALALAISHAHCGLSKLFKLKESI